ncbi:MAG: sugar phosphate isomerase/epimerase family protein [Bryobacteraceae bacterium]
MLRREFIAGALAASAAAPQPSAAQSPRFVKSICSVIFPSAKPYTECFVEAKNAGFDGIELPLGGQLALDTPEGDVRRLSDAAKKAGMAIASLWVSQPLSQNPLNSPAPAARARGVEAIRNAIRIATWMDCGALLLVPGRLGTGPRFEVGYETTWERFTAELKKAIPDATRAKVLLTMENVWNKFLVSPLEMRAFVDQFRSPWLQTHFDTGNVMQFGYPQDWILTLGPRIKRLHIKDYKLSVRSEQGRFVDLLEGDVDWKEVMAALVKVGYRGFASPEIGHDPRDPEQLVKVSRALDKILAMA